MHSTPRNTNTTHPMLRGLIFAKYGDLAASTRQRFVQALPYLTEENIALDIAPLFDNAYLAQLFKHGTRSKLPMLKAYFGRLRTLLKCRDYDFILVQYELFPYLPGVFERMIRITGKPVFTDMDDAIFHQYDQHKNGLVRHVLGNKLAPLLARADVAFCGNAYLEAYATRFAKRTVILPTVVDITRYQPISCPAKPTPVLGWIGSPSTWDYCQPVLPIISEFADAKKLSMLVVGAGHKTKERAGIMFKDWVEQDEIADIQAMDMGIMPIPNEPWARGKCGYKLIQYMACGLPVIASPVGVNTEIVTHGVNGFFASTHEEWRAAIEMLVNDPDLRERMGSAGRAAVEARYSIQTHGPRMATIIAEACRG